MSRSSLINKKLSKHFSAGHRKSWISASLILLSWLALTSCEIPFEEEPDASRDFLILSGEHYSTPRLMETFNGEKLAFRATFDESAMYRLEDPSMQANRNKLMGFSDCGTFHHENSARFAWVWLNEQLDIYAYCYVDSIRVEKLVGTVEINEENLYEISANPDKYVFFLNGEEKAAIERTPSCQEGLKYMLYPYFGGSVPAPQDIRVKIKMLH